MDELLAEFLTETSEILAELDGALLRLERAPEDRETLSLIFRLVHTIKGTCGFLGLPRLERVTHAAETVLGRVRDGIVPASPAVISLVLATLDCVREIAAALAATGAEAAGDDRALIAALDEAAEGRAVRPADVAEIPAAESAAAAATTADTTLTDAAPAEAVVAEAVAAEAVVPGAVVPEAVVAGTGAAGTGAPGTGAAGPQTIRVGVDVLETLMTLVGELVLTRNQLLQLAREHDGSAFSTPLQRLAQITSELQDGVMKTRMQPIGHAWNKLPRVVRDLAHELGKRIELTMHGGETELDRQILELIRDPLTHMVRNSADHGLEAPRERIAAGKPEAGRITLEAYHEGGHIVIRIADDGRGLAVDRIRRQAAARGLASEAELAGMSDRQIQAFIFRPGFSTAAEVTQVSGRGVGMDVVRTNIERIGGTIELDSVPGGGTTFTTRIPLTVAIVSALIVAAGGERFAIPQIGVVELVRTGGTDKVIEHIDNVPVLRLRDRLLPLVGLGGLLGLGSRAAAADATYVVVAQAGADLFGLTVDDVFDTEDIVVKPVAPILRHITAFGGNTILGDGSVIMILDPNGIARASGIVGGQAKAALATQSEPAAAAKPTAMLLFRAGGRQPLAVPLGLVARLEEIERDAIEQTGGTDVMQYRGRLMRLVAMGGTDLGTGPSQPVLVFTDGEHSIGLMVDEILDVVEEVLRIELADARPGIIGTAILAGRATDVVDIGHWLTQGPGDWFQGRQSANDDDAKRRVLVVDDNSFFRDLLVPSLVAAGYAVTATHAANAALALREAGAAFDAIVSDIMMPDMDGLAFARAVRQGGRWATVPLIALSGRAESAAVAAGRDAGFDDYLVKFERQALLDSLRQCLDARAAA